MKLQDIIFMLSQIIDRYMPIIGMLFGINLCLSLFLLFEKILCNIVKETTKNRQERIESIAEHLEENPPLKMWFLHRLLTKRLSIAELARKATKAHARAGATWEEYDYWERIGEMEEDWHKRNDRNIT